METNDLLLQPIMFIEICLTFDVDQQILRLPLYEKYEILTSRSWRCQSALGQNASLL